MTRLLPGAAALLAAREAELPQKDQLCGAFWGLLALRAAGTGAAPGASAALTAGAAPGASAALDQDAVALAAGSVLDAAARAHSLPPGEAGRADYRLALPKAGDPAAPGAVHVTASGTAATGVARAVEELSNGARTVVAASGEWSAGRLLALLERLAELGAPLSCIANLRTGRLWGTHPSPATLLAYLETGDAAAGPPAEWDVGHFTGLLGFLPARRGTLVVVADSYRSLGHDGVHLQPAERMAAALAGRGVLLAVAPDQRTAAREAVTAAGLATELWDNGSPDARAARPS